MRTGADVRALRLGGDLEVGDGHVLEQHKVRRTAKLWLIFARAQRPQGVRRLAVGARHFDHGKRRLRPRHVAGFPAVHAVLEVVGVKHGYRLRGGSRCRPADESDRTEKCGSHMCLAR